MTGSHSMFPIEKSDLYQRYQLEKIEIDKLEWLESEKEGSAIGRERAEWIWATRYRSAWLKAWVSGIR